MTDRRDHVARAPVLLPIRPGRQNLKRNASNGLAMRIRSVRACLALAIAAGCIGPNTASTVDSLARERRGLP